MKLCLGGGGVGGKYHKAGRVEAVPVCPENIHRDLCWELSTGKAVWEQMTGQTSVPQHVQARPPLFSSFQDCAPKDVEPFLESVYAGALHGHVLASHSTVCLQLSVLLGSLLQPDY